MAKKMITVPLLCGIEDEAELLASFRLKGNRYILAYDELENEYMCGRLCQGLWKGTHVKTNNVPEEAELAADTLLQASSDDPESYPLDGEYYEARRIEQQDGVYYSFRKRAELPEESGAWKWIPFCLHLAMAIALGVLYVYAYVRGVWMNSARNVFPAMPVGRLKILLYAIELAGVLVLFGVRKRERGVIDLYLNSFIPLSVITVLALWKESGLWSIVMRVILIVLGVWLLSNVFKTFASSRGKKRLRKLRELMSGMYYPAAVVAVLCIFAANSVPAANTVGAAFRPASNRDQKVMEERYYTALENIRQDVWPNLSVQEKVDTLQSISDYECLINLGCRAAKVQAGEIESEDTLGQYNDRDNTIVMNISRLQTDAVEDALDTLLHEVRHVYQHDMVRMLERAEDSMDEDMMSLDVWRQIRRYRDNFSEYQDGGENFMDYFMQDVELDSREWAEQELQKQYLIFILQDEQEI